jgi:hypothetical protein
VFTRSNRSDSSDIFLNSIKSCFVNVAADCSFLGLKERVCCLSPLVSDCHSNNKKRSSSRSSSSVDCQGQNLIVALFLLRKNAQEENDRRCLVDCWR